ncbi:MAG: DUF1648 domain-containing protein [Lewinella sp.]|nr:DUF1648 domain-containing protein [Lewinella sp.]
MSRPKIPIPTDETDRLLDRLGWLALLVMIALPAYYFNALPEVIPRHFNLQGEPDGYGSKWMIWLLPAVGAAMFFGLRALYPYPHLYNYPVEISPENAERQYRGGVKLVRSLNTLVVMVFAYLTYGTIQAGLGNQWGLGNSFTLVFLGLLAILLGYYWYQARRDDS